MRKAHEAMPTREDLGVRLALAYEQRKLDAEAGPLYDRLLKANEPSLNVRSRAGRFFARTGRRADAIAQGEAIFKANPLHPAGLYLLGEKFYWSGKFNEALDRFHEAIRLDPDPQYQEALGRACVELQKYDEATRAFGMAIEAAPEFIAPRLGRAKIHLLQREYSKAIEELEATKKLAPNDAGVWRDIGKAYLVMLKAAPAVRELEHAILLDPNDAEAHFILGKAYYDLDRPGPATDQLSRAIGLIKGDVPWMADAHLALGYAARAAKRCAVAIDAFRQYLQMTKGSGPARDDAERLLLRLQAGCN
jgi:tetratricopeptide (TPR) repeat protein